ncbi:MAG: (d)CMP kinase [Clostridiales bacterium]|nr:(d)CMP kinase [Clostridiales bacterium]
MKIALDGPAGAGKSTVAKALAKKLDIMYLDTGAMYRAVALYMLDNGITVDQKDKVEEALKHIDLVVKYEDGMQKMYLAGKDVSLRIRENAVSKAASDFSALQPVRVFLVKMQQETAQKNDCILDGRDIGTFVLPDADFKFFLTADSSERAKRRAKELAEKGQIVDVLQIQKEIEQRDYNDSHREFAPLKQAEDAVLVDSTFMTVDEVITFVSNVIEGK